MSRALSLQKCHNYPVPSSCLPFVCFKRKLAIPLAYLSLFFLNTFDKQRENLDRRNGPESPVLWVALEWAITLLSSFIGREERDALERYHARNHWQLLVWCFSRLTYLLQTPRYCDFWIAYCCCLGPVPQYVLPSPLRNWKTPLWVKSSVSLEEEQPNNTASRVTLGVGLYTQCNSRSNCSDMISPQFLLGQGRDGK